MPARFENMNTPMIGREQTMTNGTTYPSFDDEIVFTGMSGRFPECTSMEEFKKNLFEGVDMITRDDRRWPPGLYGLPERNGKLKYLDKFDASFFGVHPKQADSMDPQVRMLLESTYETIVDAGFNPAELRGTRTGVFIGVSNSETEDYLSADPDRVNGYGLTGCTRSMFANRISFTFDFKGPSFSVDTACSSSMIALHQAVTAIRTGQCDAAIVGGSNIIMRPTNSLQFHRLSMLSKSGCCKTFDVSGDGYVRSEAIGTVFLQKSSVARRVYATLISSRANCDGNKAQGITFPDGNTQNKLMREVYEEAKINPHDVSYMEAHGTGTKVGDPQEVNSIVDLFCKDRKNPLLIGSVKSNMGHAEPCSGICSLAKLLLAMEAGVVPPNLHYQNPNPDIPGLLDGRLQVVDKPTPWKQPAYGALNSFGFGGANVHLLIRGNPKPKLQPILDSPVPKMVAVSGRTQEAVDYFLDQLKEQQSDDGLIALTHEIHAKNIPFHDYRGYHIMGERNLREVQEVTNEKRPIWWVFSGMGSQWVGMGKELMVLKPFADSLRNSHSTLKTVGIDLMNLLNTENDDTYENILNSFVAIAAMHLLLAYKGPYWLGGLFCR